MNATTGGPPRGAGGPPQFLGPRGPRFTQAQRRALHNIPRVTGALSLVGSCLIMYMILKSSQFKLRKTQNRLMFAISVSDIPFSLMFFLGTWLMPSRLPFEGTYGNTQTCTMQGFFLQLGYAQPIYNAFLMIFFAVTLRGGLRDEFISRRMEPVFHVTAILFTLGTAFAGLGLDIYNPAPVGRCSINSFPLGCISNPRVDCQRGEDHEIYKWAFNLVPTLLALAVQFISLAVICYTVLRREYDYRQGAQRRGSSINSSIRAMRRESSFQGSNLMSGNTYGRRVAVRSILYALIFFNTYAWITIANAKRLVENVPPKYWIVLLGNTLQPFQGFFNFFLHLHPRYASVKKCYPHWRWYRVARYAICQGTANLPDMTRASRRMTVSLPSVPLEAESTTELGKSTVTVKEKALQNRQDTASTTKSDPEDQMGPVMEIERDEMGVLLDEQEKARRQKLSSLSPQRRVSISDPQNSEELLSAGFSIEDEDANEDKRRHSLPSESLRKSLEEFEKEEP